MIDRRQFLHRFLGGGATLALAPLTACTGQGGATGREDRGFDRLKPRSEWRDILPSERYAILFEEHTEPAFSSPLDREYREGLYICAACYQPLFDSEHKYDSGTGWPSFWRPLDPGVVGTSIDHFLFFPRTEYHCSRCGGHQGHVFDDGPEPTGDRWCNNGLALEFVPAGEDLPELRG